MALMTIEDLERESKGWHAARSRDLLPDFRAIRLAGRTVELAPGGDWRINHRVEQGVRRFAEALERQGARVRLVVLPVEVAA